MKFIKRQKTEKACVPRYKQKVAGQHPSHVFYFTSIATIPIHVTELPATNKSNVIRQKTTER